MEVELRKNNLKKYRIYILLFVHSPNEFDNDFCNHGYVISHSFNNLFLMSLVLFNTPQTHLNFKTKLK